MAETLVNDLVSEDPQIQQNLNEERELLKKKNSNTKTIEKLHRDTAEKISEILRTKPQIMEKLLEFVHQKMIIIGNFENAMATLTAENLSEIPLPIQKLLKEYITSIINFFVTKQWRPEMLNVLKRINKDIEVNLKPPNQSFLSKLKLKFKRGGRRNKTKKRKMIGGIRSTIHLALQWISVLFICCVINDHCTFCEALLVLTICMIGGPPFCENMFQEKKTKSRTRSRRSLL